MVFSSRQRKSSSKRFQRGSRFASPRIEALEGRIVLTTTLYIDYGDRYPGAVLSSTVGNLQNAQSGNDPTGNPNPRVDGPQLYDINNAVYPDATTFTLRGFNSFYGSSAAAIRSTMNQLVERFFEPLNITVVNLTAEFQTVNGRQVRAAASLEEASVTLGLNNGEAQHNDAYIFVGQIAIGPSNDDPSMTRYGGIATGTDIGQFNNNDGSALVFLAPGAPATFLAAQVAHEAGHTLGLLHTFGNSPSTPPSGSAIVLAPLQSDLMSYSAYDNFGGLNFFTRYPMVRGDGNLSNNLISTAGIEGQDFNSPFDQYANDPNIGPNPNLTYVTGTGADDIITITKTGANTAQVTVQAFSDPGYALPIPVPGNNPTGNTSFTYTISLSNPILVDAGARNDRIIIDATLGKTVTVRGMQGNDSLVVNGDGSSSGSYTPGTQTATGLDGQPDRRGKVVVGATTINFQEFELTSTVTVRNMASFSLELQQGNASITLTSVGGNSDQLAGFMGGLPIIPLNFTGVKDIQINTGDGPDQIFLRAGVLATGLQSIHVNTGGGDDTLEVDSSNGLVAVPTGIFFDAGAGANKLNLTQTGGSTHTTEVFTASAIPGEGSDVITGPGGTQSVFFKQVFPVTSSVPVTTLTFNGNSAKNAIGYTVGSDADHGLLTLDDVTTLEFTKKGALTIDGAGDDDTITLNNPNSPTNLTSIKVNGGGGNDNLILRFTQGNPIPSGGLTYDGGAGTNTITIAHNADFTLSDSALVISGAGTVGLVNVGKAILTGGAAANHFIVSNWTGTANLDGAEGSDTYTVTLLGSGSGITAIVDNGATGVDQLVVNGTANLDNITITGTGLTNTAGSANESVTYLKLEGLTVNALGGADIIKVASLATGLPLLIDGGSGIDQFTVGSTGLAGGIASVITLVGGDAEANTLTVDDSSSTTAKIVNLTSTQVGAAAGNTFFAPGGSLTYSGIHSLSFKGGNGADTIVLQSTPAGTVNIHGGGGNDSITIGSASTLTSIVAALSIDGGSGNNNSLLIDNAASTTANILTIGPNQISGAPGDVFFSAGASLVYASLQKLTVNTSSAVIGDRINVLPSATTAFIINAGDPVPPTENGDLLVMNLGSASNPTLTNTDLGAGIWTFGNAQPTSFTSIEVQNSITSISGRVFEDANGDGSGSGDAGQAGRTVQLVNNSGVVVSQQTTGANGSYLFFALPGTYQIVEVLPPGTIQTTADPAPITVGVGSQNIENVDFGNFTLTSFAGQAFHDQNGNGVQDEGDGPLVGWTINLFQNGNSTPVASVLTSSTGSFLFSDIQPGQYFVREALMTGWIQTTADPAAVVNLSGQDQTNLLFGNFQQFSISGQVVNDLNGDGQITNDTGLAVWIVELDIGADGTVDATAPTDATGNYTFTNVGPGTYRVRVEGQTGWLQTTANPADFVGQSGVNLTDINFGVFKQITISGAAFLDADADGVKDDGEAGLQGWTVFLDADGNGVLGNGETSTVTDASGAYSFANLAPGIYRVREVVKSGWVQTSANPLEITAQSGSDQTVDFGNFQTSGISGKVFDDKNGDGVRDEGDTGLAGWKVFLDLNDNGALDENEPNSTTDAAGNFSFQINIVGTARLAEVVPSGWRQTTTQSVINLVSGLTLNEDIGNFHTVSFSGQTFIDSDADGLNNSETGRNGVKISLYNDVNGNGTFEPGVDTLVATTTSQTINGVPGRYEFTGNQTGKFLIVPEAQPGRTQTAPDKGYFAISVQSGVDVTAQDFGNLAGPTQSLVYTAYQLLLGRKVDGTGLKFWSSTVDRGISRQVAVAQIAGSNEARGKIVDDLFQTYLGRKADSGALAFGINLLARALPPGGATPQQELKSIILGSSEYYAKRASQNDVLFVQNMYRDATGVTPDAATQSQLLTKLSQQAFRDSFAKDVLRTDPSYEFVVESYFQQYLHRSADSSARSFFAGNLARGAREEDIVAVLLGSTEFYNSL